MIFYLTLTAALFSTEVFAQVTPYQNGVTATGGATSGGAQVHCGKVD